MLALATKTQDFIQAVDALLARHRAAIVFVGTPVIADHGALCIHGLGLVDLLNSPARRPRGFLGRWNHHLLFIFGDVLGACGR